MEQNNLETLTKCPVCNSLSIHPFYISKDFFLTKEVFSIYHCQDCDILFTNPRPAERFVNIYYNSTDYYSHSSRAFNLISNLYFAIRKINITRKARMIYNYTDTGSLLDIGCGTGEFLYYMKRKGFDVTGIEPNLSATELAANKLNHPVYDSFLSVPRDFSFDIITMWHVLEHNYDLQNICNFLKEKILPNGHIFIALPNPDSYDAKHYREFWAGFDLPRHAYHFKPKVLIDLMKRFGFHLVKIKPLYFDSFYISILSERYQNSKQSFFKGIYYGILSNISALFGDRNYSSVIYIFKLNS